MIEIAKLKSIASEQQVKQNESMSRHTSFRIGGPADYFIEVTDEGILQKLIDYCREENEKYFILGNGSNLLVSDEGYRGVILSMRGMSSILYLEDQPMDDRQFVKVGSGILLSALASQLADRGLTGFEFAGGIPGTLGGAVTMNAGAYGGEIKDVLISARIMDKQGKIHTMQKEELELSYRYSRVQKEEGIVLDAILAFEKGDSKKIREKMKELNEQRREKQPLEYGSAGSTFKRPEGYFAGKLIQDADLRGYRVGDVMVSEKHCGFVVNVGNGTCKQAMKVIEHVQQKVYEQFGVYLETEVKILA